MNSCDLKSHRVCEMTKPTRKEIREIVIERLLQHGGGDREALRSAKDVDMITDVAVDSLHMVEIVLELEDMLGVSIPHADMTSERMRSVNRFSDYLLGKCALNRRLESSTSDT